MAEVKKAATRKPKEVEPEVVVPAHRHVDVTQVLSVTVDVEQNGKPSVVPGHLEREGWRIVSAARFNQYRVEFILVRQGQVEVPEDAA